MVDSLSLANTSRYINTLNAMTLVRVRSRLYNSFETASISHKVVHQNAVPPFGMKSVCFAEIGLFTLIFRDSAIIFPF